MSSRWWGAAWWFFWLVVVLYVIFGPPLPPSNSPARPPLTELELKDFDRRDQLWREEQERRGQQVREQEQQRARAEREKAVAEKRKASLCALSARCKTFFAERRSCAAAPDFKSCMHIRLGPSAVDLADSCGGYGVDVSLPPDTPGDFECFFLGIGSPSASR